MLSFCQEKRPLSSLCALVFIFSMWTAVSVGDFEPATLWGKESILIAVLGISLWSTVESGFWLSSPHRLNRNEPFSL